MLKYFVLLILCISNVCSIGQSSDCNTAVSVCNPVYTENDSPSGTGNVFESAPGTCQTGGEFNSAWYVFTAQQAGVISFILQPNNNNDDYDWSLFNITENGCGGINNGTSPEVSCNSWGTTGAAQGPTGISNAEGGSGTSNGPGDTNGPPFNQNLNAQAGDVFALVVMNYSATLNGYELDFGSSSSNIYDDEAPQITSITQNCEADQLTITFSENVLMSGLIPIQFPMLNIGNTIYPNDLTLPSSEYANQLTLSYTSAISTGNCTMMDNVNSPIEDICGNPWTVDFDFNVEEPFAFGNVAVENACNGTGGQIEITNNTSGNGPLSIELNGTPQSDFVFENLNAGDYEITVIDASDCSYTMTATVSNGVINIDAGPDQVLCSMQTSLSATHGPGTFQWSNPFLNFGNAYSGNTSVTATLPGTQIITATVTNGNCQGTDNVSITFNFPPDVDLQPTGVSCYSFCDGKIKVTNTNASDITVSIGNETQTGDQVDFNNLCAGEKNVYIEFSPNCNATYLVDVVTPNAVIALFEATPWTTNIENPIFQLASLSTNADSLFWSVNDFENLFSNDTNWLLTLPPVVGDYYITLQAFDSIGCMNEFVASVVIKDNFHLYIPNSFTPNDDGINDFFLPQFSYDPSYYALSIFNRWGDTIFITNDFSMPWVGDVHSGENFAADGIYLWRLVVKGDEPEIIEKMGIVTMIR